MTDDAFIRTICARPKDDSPRLVYADYLEEQGEADRAELIRIQIKQSHVPGYHRYLLAAGREESLADGRAIRLLVANPEWAFPVATVFADGFRIDAYGYAGTAGGIKWRWHRGFVETLVLPWRAWATRHAALTAATPVAEVYVTTTVSAYFSPARVERVLPQGPWSIRMAARWEADVDPLPQKTMYTAKVYKRTPDGWDENSAAEDFNHEVESYRSIGGFLAAMWPGVRFTLPDDSQRILRMTNSINFIETILSEE